MSISYYSEFHPEVAIGAKGSAAFLPTLSSAPVYLYLRSSVVLTSADKPNGNVIYTFSTGNTDTSAVTNNWTASFPSGDDELYIVYAIATGEGTTDVIGPSEWSTPVLFVRNGLDGGPSGNFILGSVTGEGWVYSNAEYSPSSTGTNVYERNRAVFLGEGVIWFVGDTLEYLERTAVTPGQTYYMSLWLYKSSTATGDISGRVELYNAAGVNIGVEDVGSITTSGGPTDIWYQKSSPWPCPEGVAYVRPLAGNNTGGTSNTVFVAMPFFGSQQLGADVSLAVLGPTSASYNYTSAGVLDPSTQFPETLIYQLEGTSGIFTFGVAWQYRIIEGSVNGFAASTTLRSIGVSNGAAQFTITDLGSNTAQIEIIGARGGQSSATFLTLTKVFAASPVGGGGGANTVTQTSGFIQLPNTTSFTTISQELEIASAGTTTQTVTVSLSFTPPATVESLSTVELIIERWNGSSWVQMGAAATDNSEVFFDEESNRYIRLFAQFSLSRTQSITAGTNQRCRVRARLQALSTTHSVFGTVSMTA